jgi:hypothetical protein
VSSVQCPPSTPRRSQLARSLPLPLPLLPLPVRHLPFSLPPSHTTSTSTSTSTSTQPSSTYFSIFSIAILYQSIVSVNISRKIFDLRYRAAAGASITRSQPQDQFTPPFLAVSLFVVVHAKPASPNSERPPVASISASVSNSTTTTTVPPRLLIVVRPYRIPSTSSSTHCNLVSFHPPDLMCAIVRKH